MSDTMNGRGHCLCGEVSFDVPNINKSVGACHCSMCRNWCGGPLMAVECGSDVTFKGQQNISVYNSSEWAERGFCNKCGSHLFYRLKEQQLHFLPYGLFENQEQFEFDHQVFIDKKPSTYSFANDTRNETEAEVFAKYEQ